MLLNKKSAVITGCNRGIGKKILETFYENGANVFACVRKLDDEFKNFIDKKDIYTYLLCKVLIMNNLSGISFSK